MKEQRFIDIMNDLGMPDSRSLLLALLQVAHEAGIDAQTYERKRCATLAAPEHIPYNDQEWRVRCEVRDAILDA